MDHVSQGPQSRVLVVDDHEGDRITTAALLSDLYLVDTAKNGEAALAFLSNPITPYVCVCSDHTMGGGMNGIQLLRLLPPYIGKVLITGHSEVVEPGFFILIKPFSEEDLLRTVGAAVTSAKKKRSGAWRIP